jgi:hypothetical protein
LIKSSLSINGSGTTLIKQWLLGLLCLMLTLHQTHAQDTTRVPRHRLPVVLGSSAVLYSASLVGLNELWYKGFPRQQFSFFNDNDEWRGMDKMGHVFSAYHLGLMGISGLEWAGASPGMSTWLGGASGFIYLSAIELLDAYSAGWGFSPGDMMANTLGYLLAAGQHQAWKEQRIIIKFSFSPSGYAPMRPNLLGKNLAEQIMKDYNGQTYWLSASPATFIKGESKFPRWLCLSFGYSVDGLIGARSNVWTSGGATYDFSSIPRRSQYLLSVDIDLRQLPFNYKWYRSLSQWLGFIKIPAPAFEFGQRKFHPLYF